MAATPQNADRYEAIEAAKRLLARLETPFERSWALAFENPVLIAGLQLCQDLGVWSKWASQQGNDGGMQSLDTILKMCNVPVHSNLLRRFLRHLAALNVLEEIGVDMWRLGVLLQKPWAMKKQTFSFLYKPGNFSTEFPRENFTSRWESKSNTLFCSVVFLDGPRQTAIDINLQLGGVNLARFLAKNHYQEPLDKTKFDNYADLFGSDFFELCQRDPSAGGSFIGLMTALATHKMDWTGVYDTNTLVQGADFSESGPALFVDVGGAHGLDSARFFLKHPELPTSAKIVVQDLPEVVSAHEHAKETLSPRIERMAYNFFQPQPLLGARAYFFHAVPHDWPDVNCKKIFQNVRAAMRKGYSKLLIYEVVMPSKGATSLVTTLDLQLMNNTSGYERTEGDWRDLLREVGLGIVHISRHPRAVESVIEAEVL